jgi:hypothetical protein
MKTEIYAVRVVFQAKSAPEWRHAAEGLPDEEEDVLCRTEGGISTIVFGYST